LTVEDGLWDVRLAALANADFRDIFDWTYEQFGGKQALVYADTIIMALDALVDGPTTIGVKERAEIAKGLFTLSIARRAARTALHTIPSGRQGPRPED
jgi:toxin ParE1/3/4